LEDQNTFAHGISIIEWGEIIENILPPNYIKVTIEKDLNQDNIRHISIYEITNKEIC